MTNVDPSNTPHIEPFGSNQTPPPVFEQPVQTMMAPVELANTTGHIQLQKAMSEGWNAMKQRLGISLLFGLGAILVIGAGFAAIFMPLVGLITEAFKTFDDSMPAEAKSIDIDPSMAQGLLGTMFAGIGILALGGFIFAIMGYALSWTNTRNAHTNPSVAIDPNNDAPKRDYSLLLLGLGVFASSVLGGIIMIPHQLISMWAGTMFANDNASGVSMAVAGIIILVVALITYAVLTGVQFIPWTVCHFRELKVLAFWQTIITVIKPMNVLKIFAFELLIVIATTLTFGLGMIILMPLQYTVLATIYYNDIRPVVENKLAAQSDLEAEFA